MEHEALYYTSLPDGEVRCGLCPHNCVIKNGKEGICRIRKNINGQLFALSYGKISAIKPELIEKNSIYHFYSGTNFLSVGSYSCNMRCYFCHTTEFSQSHIPSNSANKYFSPEELVELALQIPSNTGISFAVNEPVIWYEYVLDTAILAKKAGLKTVMPTNGFINEAPLKKLLEYIDAFVIDLKGFTEEFYEKATAGNLESIKKSLKLIHATGKHLEITHTLIPGLNDNDVDFRKMVEWISKELSPLVPFHILRHYSNFKTVNSATDEITARQFARIANHKLSFVYATNLMSEDNNTLCPKCGNLLIRRMPFNVQVLGLTKSGGCKECGTLFS